MQSPIGRGRKGNSPLNNRRIAGGKEALSREEKTYREIMGPDGKVRPQFQHLMIDLEIDSEDLLDKKLDDFRRDSETKVNEEILQTRYDFHHSKRIFKLQELCKLRERQRHIENEKAQLRQLQEVQKLKKLSARDDAGEAANSRLPSQHAITRPVVSTKPSQMQSDYASANPVRQSIRGMGGFPGIPGTKKESNSRLQNSSSRVIDGRQTPRQSSMNVRGDGNKRNDTGAFFLTQPDQMPRTGASASRNGKMAPLLTPGVQRIANMNQSQAFSPHSSSYQATGFAGPNEQVQVTADEVMREKEKIARFLNTKERNGRVLAERENRITNRIKEMEKKAMAFEKRRKNERKMEFERLQEREEQWRERRKRVVEHNIELDNKAYGDYKKVVFQSKKRKDKELDGSDVVETKVKAREELLAKSRKREMEATTVVSAERESIQQTLKTLETLESKVKAHNEKAQMHRLSMSQKINVNYERVRSQGTTFKERQAAEELMRQGQLLEKLNARQKALDKYEKKKRNASIVAEERNKEKLTLTKQCQEQRRQEIKEIQRNIKQKDLKVAQKLQQVEDQRLAEVEVRREKQRLIAEDNKKRIEFKKRNLNFKKLQVLDKHQRIEQLCNQLSQNKNSFIECTRLANEIRVQKMAQVASPAKSTGLTRKASPVKGAEAANLTGHKTQA